MPSGFWDYIHLSRSRTDEEDDQAHHNLQEGLFQIASQTCNILVQVNNTNNINLGPDFHYSTSNSSEFAEATTSKGNGRKTTTFFDMEQSVVLLQPKQSGSSTPTRGRLSIRLSEYKRRLSVSRHDIFFMFYELLKTSNAFDEENVRSQARKKQINMFSIIICPVFPSARYFLSNLFEPKRENVKTEER